MEINVDGNALFEACSLAISAAGQDKVGTKGQYFKLVADDSLTIMASDAELGVRVGVGDAKIRKGGECLISATKLVSILREVAADRVSLQLKDESCFLDAGSSQFEMITHGAAYHDIEDFSPEAYHEIPSGTLKDIIRRTIFAVAAVAHNRFGATTGMLWDLGDDHLSLVGSDGRRLAVAGCACERVGGHTIDGRTSVVSKKTMSLLERTLDDSEAKVKVSFTSTDVCFSFGNTVIRSRLVEGRYPQYKLIIPNKLPIRFNIESEILHRAIRQTAIMADADSRRISFEFKGGKLLLQAKGSDTGRSKVEIPVEFTGKMEIDMNSQILLEMLKLIDGDMLIEMKDHQTPVVFHASKCLYVVVPIVSKAE